MRIQIPSIQTRKLLEYSLLPGMKPKQLRSIAIFMKKCVTNALEVRGAISDEFEIDLSKVNNCDSDVEKLYEKCEKFEITIISYLDDDYPSSLKSISDFPPILYVRGAVESLSNIGCSVIGTRKASSEGIKLTKKISKILVENDYSIISGLALGIDAAAHEETLQRNGTAIAVLAHGLEKILPKKNQELGYKIIESDGALVSEYPPGTSIHKGNFVRRNRIQSGLSICTVLVESGEKGGSIHHANFADNQGKKVFCILPNSSAKFKKLDTSGALRLVEDDKATKISNSSELICALNELESPSKLMLK